MSENAEAPGCTRTVFPDPNVQESLQCENIPDPLAGEQTWPTEEVWGRILFQPMQTQGPGLQVSSSRSGLDRFSRFRVTRLCLLLTSKLPVRSAMSGLLY